MRTRTPLAISFGSATLLCAALVVGPAAPVGANVSTTESTMSIEDILRALDSVPGSETSTPTTTESTAGSTAPTTPDTASTTPGTTATSTPGSTPGAGGDFNWQPIGSRDGLEEGTLKVPLDYTKPDGPTVSLYVVRHKAGDPAKKIGTLLVNPGGPGFGGTFLALQAEFVYSQKLLDAFDIVAWDPRGTGKSEPHIDCIESDEYDKYYANVDITPQDQAGKDKIRDMAKAYAQSCEKKNAELIQFVGTNNSARDMNAIREALGEKKISYFGFSYGSELGGTWATMFPQTVRAAVLDGAADPTADPLTRSIQQNKGFEGTLHAFLADCAKDPSCEFYHDGKTEEAFDALMAKLDASPIPSRPGRPDVDHGVALGGVVQAMYSQTYWPQLRRALADAEKGDGSGLLDLFDAYFQRQMDGTYTNDLEAFQTIHCMDQAERTDAAKEDADAAKVHEAAPRLAPGTAGGYFCSFFPKSADPRAAITGKGAGPIVVVGTTGDPATPLESSRNMAKALEDGRLVVVTADKHTGYDVNQCSRDTVDDYLLDPAANAPKNETECK